MMKLKLRSELEQEKTMSPSCCCGTDESCVSGQSDPQMTCCSDSAKDKPVWINGFVKTAFGFIPKVSTDLSRADHWEHFKCRTNSFRNNYTVNPGLYAVGSPDKNSDVLVSANYKFSFDMLRRELTSMNVWILVLDTKGINVWCAAGKGTFGTDELVSRINITRLKDVVSHRRIIVPQLGAPGVSAYQVKAATGFNVLFGPVLAKDIPAYISSGYKATKEMRTVTFEVWDRLVLTPIELHQIRRKFLLFTLITLVYFGLTPSGILFAEAFSGGSPFVLLGCAAVFAGGITTPLLLPFIPFRSFALKGWITGIAVIFLSMLTLSVPDPQSLWLTIFSCLFFPLVSSYLALQFTGATTFTGMAGVKKELKIAAPIYISGAAVSVVFLIINKLLEWGIA
jgi:hypothetical protein